MSRDAGSRARPAMTHATAAVRDGDVIYSRLSPVGERESVGGLLTRNAERYARRPVYLEREGETFRGVTWAAFARQVAAFGRFLAATGAGPGTRVAVFSPNRGEMLVTELATMCIGATFAPIFAGYPADQACGLIEQAKPTVLVIAGGDQLWRICVPPTVRAVVTYDPVVPAALDATLTGTGVSHACFGDIAGAAAGTQETEAGLRSFLEAATRVNPDEPCLMNFTSGTSGILKGVLLTHDNILSQQRALSAIWSVGSDDRLLSYLPWHHSFGGIFEKYTALFNGAALHLDDSLGKDFDRLLRNWLTVRPTVYFSVPQVYQQLVTHAQMHPEDDARIFHPELRFVFTAAAPLPANVSQFFASRGIPVLEGWGLTETAPCCTLTDLHEARSVPGMVGYPIPGVRLRIAADGEILAQGPNVMRGYFENARANAAALPGDGWFHTGDLGEFVGAGLKLVARKDRVFKMLNAEKVVPTALENQLAGMNRYIRHVIVAGDGRRFLAALVFPDFFRIREEFGDDRTRAEQVVKASLRETFVTFNRAHRVKYEHIQAFAVVAKELSIEAHELTPSMKVRVRNVLSNAAPYLEAVYEPSADCDCRFLRKVMRIAGDDRLCFAGNDRTLDRCHECGSFVFEDARITDPQGQRRAGA